MGVIEEVGGGVPVGAVVGKLSSIRDSIRRSIFGGSDDCKEGTRSIDEDDPNRVFFSPPEKGVQMLVAKDSEGMEQTRTL